MEVLTIETKNIYINRELSWLKFNRRVLEEVISPSTPPLEKLKFMSIVSSNLDEFFMIRVGTLYDHKLLDKTFRDNKSGMTLEEQLRKILEVSKKFTSQQNKAFKITIDALRSYKINHLSMSELDAIQHALIKDFFNTEIVPILSPQIVDNKHPFPHLENRAVYICVNLKRKDNQYMGFVPIPKYTSSLINIPNYSGTSFVLVEDVIEHYAHELFKGYEKVQSIKLKVIRNADISMLEGLSDEEVDYRIFMRDLIKKRVKLAPVRLEISKAVNDVFLAKLLLKLNLVPSQVFIMKIPLSFSYISKLERSLEKNLKESISFKALTPQLPPWYDENENMLEKVEKGDLFLSYPFESIKPFLKLLRDAIYDSSVVSIKITLYRLSGDSKLINLLIEAVDRGKDVTAVLELRARFDEENNINWSEKLEAAGCHVVYGLEEYKIHSKIMLITRKRGNQISYITHIGTGNYNEKTAEVYTDLNIITANRQIAEDGVRFFNNITISNIDDTYNVLKVSPLGIKNAFLSMIDNEIKMQGKYKNGRIIIKCNSLTDKEVIDKLAEASEYGVKIDMIIRGICCLLPGIEGVTDNISVQSIVGRFLEHSRIYYFNNNGEKNIYISSADLMTRNMERRIEIAAPVYDIGIKTQIIDILNILLQDDKKARVLKSNGKYYFKDNKTNINSQLYFYERAYSDREKALIINKPSKRGKSKFSFFKFFDFFKKINK